MFFWNCEAASPFDYLVLLTAATCWVYAAWCLIQMPYERRTPLTWWEPGPFGSRDLTPAGRDYHRRLFLAVLAGPPPTATAASSTADLVARLERRVQRFRGRSHRHHALALRHGRRLLAGQLRLGAQREGGAHR